MAVTMTLYGSTQNKTAATTVSLTTTAIIPANTLMVLAVCADNVTATTPGVTGVFQVGTGYQNLQLGSVSQSGASTTAGSGVFVYAWTTVSQGSVASGTAIQITFDSSPVTKAVALWGFTETSGVNRGIPASVASAAGTPSIVTAGTAPVAGDIVIGVVGGENSVVPTGDADTLNGSWSAINGIASSGGSANTNCAIGMQYKVVTAGGAQTYNPVTANDSVAIVFTFRPSPITLPLSNTFEGGTNGTNITASNSGGTSGDNFSAGTTPSPVYSNTVAHSGALSMQVPTSIVTSLLWFIGASRSVYWRGYLYVPTGSVPPTFTTPLLSGNTIAFLSLSTAGKLISGSTTSTTTVPLNQWVRIEAHGTSPGVPTIRLFTSPDSATPTEEFTGTGTITYDHLRIGLTAGATASPGPLYFDDIAVGEIDWLGSSLPVPTISQGPYRFYADGTESASVAVAAQDTAYAADVTAGDVNTLLRTRLQSTNTTAPAATDDWQLQYETNASGVWVSVSASDVLVDTLDFATANVGIGFSADDFWGQSFLGNGGLLTRASFALDKTGTPPGNLTARLYAHTGTYGAGGTGVDPVLATSTSRLATSTNTTKQWEDFVFDGTYRLVSGTPYVIVVGQDATDISNYVTIYRNASGGAAHSGNQVRRNVGVWDATTTEDVAFRVFAASSVGVFNSANLTDAAATTNRLGAGTGSFVAGKVSEDGLVDDLGWTANNFTEVLYALTLKRAGLANADTLRFRVQRNSATTGLTYTSTPTINVTKSGGAVIQPPRNIHLPNPAIPASFIR